MIDLLLIKYYKTTQRLFVQEWLYVGQTLTEGLFEKLMGNINIPRDETKGTDYSAFLQLHTHTRIEHKLLCAHNEGGYIDLRGDK